MPTEFALSIKLWNRNLGMECKQNHSRKIVSVQFGAKIIHIRQCFQVFYDVSRGPKSFQEGYHEILAEFQEVPGGVPGGV